MRVGQNDSDDRAGLRGYVQFNKYTYIHSLLLYKIFCTPRLTVFLDCCFGVPAW